MTSQYKGVWYHPRCNCFQARISWNGRPYHLGSHHQEQQAAKAYDKALFVTDRAGEMQIGLTTEEMQQLQGVSLEQLVSAFRAESASFSRGSSAYRGVAYHKRQCKYQAQLRIEGGKTVYLGQFICEEDAARAYDAAVRQHHGSKALLNFPDAEDLSGPTAGPPSGATSEGRNSQANAAADDCMQAMQAVVAAEACGNVPRPHEGRIIAQLPLAVPNSTNKANSPGERPLATRSPAATAARVNAPTPASLSTNSPNILGPATTSSAIPGPSTSVRAQLVPARTASGLGAASGPAAASGPSTSGSLSFSQPELCNFAGEALEDQDNKEEEDTEDSEDGLLTDSDDLSSWGSDEEIWGSDSDYYETDEDEEALADLYNHPDYKYLVRHNGEPNLSLFGGPDANITPANLLKKLMVKWREEAEESPHSTASVTSTHTGVTVLPERWEDGGSSGAGGGLPNPPAPLLGKSAEGGTGAGRSRRKKRSLKPSEEALAMANSGCRAVPGMSPADFREAVYYTYMTTQPWGMKLIKRDSEEDDSNMSDDEDEPQVLRPGRDRLPEDETDSEDDEEERAQKRSKLTEATQGLGVQVAALQKRMGITADTDASSAQIDKPGSIPWWAREVGMTEEEYWSGLHSTADGSGGDMPQGTARKVEMTQEDLGFLASLGTSKRRSILYL